MFLASFRERDRCKTSSLRSTECCGNLILKWSINRTNLHFARDLAVYGIDKIEVQDSIVDEIMVEKLILKDMLAELLEKNTRSLAKILTPKSVRQYRSLARRYLMDSNPDKESVQYQIYKEYEKILTRV